MSQICKLRHIVMCAFKAEADSGQCDQIVADFSSLHGKITQITDFEHGVDVSPEGLSHGFTHCFTLTFASGSDRDAYLVHPEHLAFVERLKPWLEKVLVLDYWT